MNTSSTFTLIPWQNDFLKATLNVALEENTTSSSEALANSLFIFPFSRPAKYLQNIIIESPLVHKPCRMPRIMPVHQLFAEMYQELYPPAKTCGFLDRVGLVWQCIQEEQREHGGLLERLPLNNTRDFFPWGVRLATLFEEFFIHNKSAANFMYLEDELEEYAGILLGRLGSLQQRYITALETHGRTTAAFTAYKCTEKIASGSYYPRLIRQYKNIYISGFYSLNGTEDVLFKFLWEQCGAKVLVHADPNLVKTNSSNSEQAHWSCAEITNWANRWKARLELYQENVAQPQKHYQYFGGYDIHSQLGAMSCILKQEEDLEDTAIILPDTRLLLPALHSLPDVDVNISMGYPLDRSTFYRLLETVLNLQRNQRGGNYYWKDCIQLIRHPYIKMLGASDDDASKAWRGYLQRVETELRNGSGYVNFAALLSKAYLAEASKKNLEKIKTLYSDLQNSFLLAWEGVKTLAELANAVESLCHVMLLHGANIWQRFPIDAECLYRFLEQVVPELAGSYLSHDELSRPVTFAIFKELLKAERVAFEADPLTALQIMGLLESRLIHFKRIVFLDATDDVLPGGKESDPLFPDSLRSELGLPNTSRKQLQTSYYFFRLINGAEKVYFFWQDGVEPQGLQDGKKLKSRFIEELLWQEEQKKGRMLKPVKEQAAALNFPALRDDSLTLLSCPLISFTVSNREIPVTGAVAEGLNRFLEKPISATALNGFMRCPLSFYYNRLAALNPVNEVQEDEDPAAVGDLFHHVLHEFYSAKLGQKLKEGSLHSEELVNLFSERLEQSPLSSTLPVDTLSTLRAAAPKRLSLYLEGQPETTPIALESVANASLQTPEVAVSFTGTLDRIDRRVVDEQEGLVILDYKTGRAKLPVKDFWHDTNLWKAIEKAPIYAFDRELFFEVATNLQDVQLPLYLYLLNYGSLKNECQVNLAAKLPVVNAGIISLRSDGLEKMLFAESLADEVNDIVEGKVPKLLGFIINQLKNIPAFEANKGQHCSYCAYSNICIVL